MRAEASALDPHHARFACILVTIVMFALRSPHIRRSTGVRVVRHAVGPREVILVALVAVGLLVLPLMWVFTALLAWADIALSSAAFAGGLVLAALGLWLLHRSHVDLGRNWSNTLQVREGHALVTGGVYRRVRHPMYGALLLHALGQALFVPNWIAGPAYLVTFVLLVAARMGPEERMMAETFGEDWSRYRARTARLLPGVW